MSHAYSTMYKKLIIALVVLATLGAIAFLYMTRAPDAPTQDAGARVSGLAATEREKLYRIDSSGSRVTFSIGEVLRGKPFTAVGVTSNLAGDIVVSNSAVTVGTLAVNARTFKTDSVQRDGAISRFILKSDNPANEFINFKPTGPVPISTQSNSAVTFTLSGDLTVSGVTKPVSFTVVGTRSDQAFTGKATVTLKRSDFKLVIPNIPFVASVDDEFTVTADVVAPVVN
jgi:polyisoprenoid-binding protein YceI